MATFPSIKPTKRSFALGEYPMKAYRALSGKVIRRAFGNRPYGATLELVFENINQDTLDALYQHYHGQQGTINGFDLPNAVWAGLDRNTPLVRQLKNGEPFIILQSLGIGDGIANTMQWFYADIPEVESTQRDRSTVTVKLMSEFRR